jgi:hypothetical protein
MQSSQTTTNHPAGETFVQCLRIGTPPYRFYGVSLSFVEAIVSPELTLFAQLWQRRKGDYVTYFSGLSEVGWRPDAYAAPTVEKAIKAMEQICAVQKPAAFPSDLHQCQDGLDKIAAVMQARHELQQFNILIGRALDAWSLLEPDQRIAS